MAGESEAPATLEAALGRIAELQGQMATLGAERDATSARATELEARLATEGEPVALTEARATSIAHLRRALLAENAGRVVPELVAGETPEALEASIAVARAAWDRATDAAKQALRADRVPTGAPTRAGGDAGAEGLSSLGKIARGLRTE